MKKILVPSDFSQNAKHALQFAAELASKAGANLEVLHVNTAAAYAPLLSDQYHIQTDQLENYNAAAAQDLQNLKAEFAEKHEGLNIQTRSEEGFLHSELNRIAEEDGCDLLVMGTRGATSAKEFFVGSNTEKLIRTSSVPVLAVPEVSGDLTVKTVVLPSTLHGDQVVAFKTLAEWQKYFDFKVNVLYLNNPRGLESNEEIEAEMEKLANAAGLKNVDLYTSSNTFNEERAILTFAEETKADLIAMATHQRRGISHMMFGSLTEDTANHSKVPVLCIPIAH